jgi:Ni/Fe-hydrogenase subunit HybB-like protein
MAMFGFVYLWYLMAVLLLELWFEFRKDLVLWSKDAVFPMNLIYRILSFFSTDVSDRAVAFDHKAIRIITLIGVPSAFLLHGYVGFIFGSVKANPWWGSVLMPLVFLMSAIVSGIALVIFLYMVVAPLKGQRVDMRCLDKITSYLFYAVIVDFTLEVLDFIHRLYQSEESIKILSRLVMDKLFVSLWIIQVLLGMLVPLAVMVAVKSLKFTEELRRLFYFASVILIQLGIFATRWNVVVGGQLFSKSFRGLTTYKMEVVGIEGLFVAIALLIAPFIILTVFLKIFPAWETESGHEAIS